MKQITLIDENFETLQAVVSSAHEDLASNQIENIQGKRIGDIDQLISAIKYCTQEVEA